MAFVDEQELSHFTHPYSVVSVLSRVDNWLTIFLVIEQGTTSMMLQ